MMCLESWLALGPRRKSVATSAATEAILQPAVLARLGSLELIARAVVEGAFVGLHRSPKFGFSQEFAEYRAYNEGDDLRFVDWNVFARTDRAYIKRFKGDTNTRVTVLLDASGSMNFGNPVSKWQLAQYLCASLAYLIKNQHDAFGLTVFNTQIVSELPPSSNPDLLQRVLSQLHAAKPEEGTDLVQSLQALSQRITRRGLVILVSDLYANSDELIQALQPLAHSGQELIVFHTLDREELEPNQARISALKDLETSDKVIVAPEFLSGTYRTRINEHCEAIESTCRRMGAEYVRVMTDEPLDSVLHSYLRRRETQPS